ncbi:MAG: phosphotransferase family protein [Haloarculaceae archaeon]
MADGPDDDAEGGIDRLVDRDALRSFLAAKLGEVDAIEIQRHQVGHSNETLFVTWGDRELVLRRPPPGETAESAHDVLREARFMDAVADAGVAVPSVVATCDDRSVVGSDFFVMERLEGDVIRTEEPDRFAAPEQRRRVGTELVETLADVHAVDWREVGLAEFGPGERYLERQVDLWRTQLEEWLLPSTTEHRDLPHVEDVAEWLAANIPEESDETLVHGDFKLDNVMFEPGTPPEVVGVFDWEMATVGDPLADLGWMLLFWPDAGDPDHDIPAELLPPVTTREGYLTRCELVARYEDATGREFVNERFYRGLAAYKITTACEAMYLRHVSGAADDPMYPLLERGVPAMAARARRIVEGEEPL